MSFPDQNKTLNGWLQKKTHIRCGSVMPSSCKTKRLGLTICGYVSMIWFWHVSCYVIYIFSISSNKPGWCELFLSIAQPPHQHWTGRTPDPCPTEHELAGSPVKTSFKCISLVQICTIDTHKILMHCPATFHRPLHPGPSRWTILSWKVHEREHRLKIPHSEYPRRKKLNMGLYMSLPKKSQFNIISLNVISLNVISLNIISFNNYSI